MNRCFWMSNCNGL